MEGGKEGRRRRKKLKTQEGRGKQKRGEESRRGRIMALLAWINDWKNAPGAPQSFISRHEWPVVIGPGVVSGVTPPILMWIGKRVVRKNKKLMPMGPCQETWEKSSATGKCFEDWAPSRTRRRGICFRIHQAFACEQRPQQ